MTASARAGWITTEDEVHLASRWWRAADASHAVVLVHGFAASREEPELAATAAALNARGLDVLTYDGRGHGDSGGLCTLGDLERFDVAAAVHRARRDHDRVVVVGASMGAIAVLRYGADRSLVHREVLGVVTVSAPASWRVPRTPATGAAALLTQTPPGRALARRVMGVRLAKGWSRPEPPDVLAARLPVPLGVIHGDADRFIPVGEAGRLVAGREGPHRVVTVPGMGHAYHPASHPPLLDLVGWCARGGTDAPPEAVDLLPS